MYLIKEISINELDGSIKITDGIKCAYIDNQLVVIDQYFGEAEIWMGTFADKSKLTCNKHTNERLLTYCNEITVNELGDGYKKLIFNVSTYNNKVNGYIVFIKYSSTEIKTSAKKIYGRYPNDAIILIDDLSKQNTTNVGNHFLETWNGNLFVNV